MTRLLFVSENIGGHATMHRHIKTALARDHPDIDAEFVEAAHRGPLRRVVGASVPGLARADLDFAPLRSQLAASIHLHRRMRQVKQPIDGLHVYTHHAAIAWPSELARIPSVVSLDATGAQSSRLLPYRVPTKLTRVSSSPARMLERQVYDHAAAVVAKSEWAASSLVDDYGLHPDRIHVIPYGITMPSPGVHAVREHRPDPAVVFVGRSMERRGGWRLLSLWKRHLQRQCRLILVTPEDVPPEPGLEVVRSLAPGDEAMFRMLARASVLAFPGEMDTFGYAPIEAMAVGVPVVAFRSGAIGEVVLDDTTGLLVERGDDEELAAALRMLLADDALRQTMGQAGMEWVRDRFDARVTTAALVTLMQKVRDDAGPGLRG